MSRYRISLDIFKKILKQNPSITREEWDEYAMENCLFSAFTLEAHANVYNFEDLKKKYKW